MMIDRMMVGCCRTVRRLVGYSLVEQLVDYRLVDYRLVVQARPVDYMLVEEQLVEPSSQRMTAELLFVAVVVNKMIVVVVVVVAVVHSHQMMIHRTIVEEHMDSPLTIVLETLYLVHSSLYSQHC
jgi:hypothetical protein